MNKLALIAFFSALSILLSGCTSIPISQVNDRLNAWKGMHIDDLIKYWGLPSKQTQTTSKYYAEWLNRSNEPGNASVSIGTGHLGRNSAIGIGLSLFELGGSDDACSRLITYNDNGVVTDISWQGTQDYCYQLTPELSQIQANQKSRKTQ
ncbi:hypothetical protein [Aliikangiella sp. IMCC44359]|uniref:hypothetical protein n=1 Tax=Aliikangiella sp. IMCC44359 TaxID=3459125 RepID=UPI00403ACDE4